MTFEEIKTKMKLELDKYGSVKAPMIWQCLMSRHFAEYKDLYKRWLLYKCKYCPKRHEKHCE